jgi:hypothetical protein
MTKDAAREARRETLEDLIEALRAIGSRGLTGSAADAFAKANQCVGRLQGIDELEAYEDACNCGQPARFPRPIIETIDPGDITDEMIDDAAWRAANEQDLAEAAEAFEAAEEEESIGELCDALDRAAEGGGAR